MGHDVVAIERNLKVGLQGQQSRHNAGKALGKVETLGCKSTEGAQRNDAMRVISENVVLGWIQISFLIKP